MRSRKQVTHPSLSRPRRKSVTLVREVRRVTIRYVPRGKRRVDETPESAILDATAREFHRVEARLEALREQLRKDAVAAVRAGMSKAEAARRAGYTREYVSRLVTESDARDILRRKLDEAPAD